MKCKHPALLRRIVASMSGLPNGVVNQIDGVGKNLQKISNTIRFEKFWNRHVRDVPGVQFVPSFTSVKSKHPIWNIAIDLVKKLDKSGTVLEFGTNNGGSLLYFQSHLPASMRFVGFDCFEGLPEAWDTLPAKSIKGFGMPLELWGKDPEVRKNVLAEFEASGVMPRPPQPNISIESGLFSESVPRYLSAGIPKNVVFIHFDADLYISTRPVLDTICGQLKNEYYILFDEFYSANHEFRAWIEFVDLFKHYDWRVVAAAEDGVQMLFHVNPPK